MRCWTRWLAITMLAVVVLLAAIGSWLNFRDESPIDDRPAAATAGSSVQIERGRYLATVGNCMGCHTARGGKPMAGGVGIATPFGTLYSSNLTPDVATGIGSWNASHFWRAMHNGRSKDGRLLYPAFPYTSYTTTTREDSDAIFAWLRTFEAASQANTAHSLRFPYDTQLALGAWRALYFSPARFVEAPAQSREWNRGAYLINGLGHCAACHSSRNVFGATVDGASLRGGIIAGQNWYAPPLGELSEPDIVSMLRTGLSSRGSASGPMADVVHSSTQYLTDTDLAAMAAHLEGLPGERRQMPAASRASINSRGGVLYDKHCASCHGSAGEGQAGIYPPLAGNFTVNLESATNVVQVILAGGFAVATESNPRPFSMPPFKQSLGDADIAAVASYVRQSFGNGAGAVSEVEVRRVKNSGP
ncbi:cytochrome c [soil metagenome]